MHASSDRVLQCLVIKPEASPEAPDDFHRIRSTLPEIESPFSAGDGQNGICTRNRSFLDHLCVGLRADPLIPYSHRHTGCERVSVRAKNGHFLHVSLPFLGYTPQSESPS